MRRLMTPVHSRGHEPMNSRPSALRPCLLPSCPCHHYHRRPLSNLRGRPCLEYLEYLNHPHSSRGILMCRVGLQHINKKGTFGARSPRPLSLLSSFLLFLLPSRAPSTEKRERKGKRRSWKRNRQVPRLISCHSTSSSGGGGGRGPLIYQDVVLNRHVWVLSIWISCV